jgi:hypothetical protein
MGKILRYIPHILTILTFAGVVWRAAVYFERQDAKLSKIEKNDNDRVKTDSIQRERLNDILSNQNELYWYALDGSVRMENLDRSYQFFLKSHNEKDFLLNYIEQLQMDLKKNEQTSISKIPLRPVLIK